MQKGQNILLQKICQEVKEEKGSDPFSLLFALNQ